MVFCRKTTYFFDFSKNSMIFTQFSEIHGVLVFFLYLFLTVFLENILVYIFRMDLFFELFFHIFSVDNDLFFVHIRNVE